MTGFMVFSRLVVLQRPMIGPFGQGVRLVFYGLNLNLNSLLVKRQIDKPSPGVVTGGKLVPSSHKRGELRYAII